MGKKGKTTANASPARSSRQAQKDAGRLQHQRSVRDAELREVEAAAARVEAAGRKRQASRSLSTALADIPEEQTPEGAQLPTGTEQPAEAETPQQAPSAGPGAQAAAAGSTAPPTNASAAVGGPGATNDQIMEVLQQLVSRMNALTEDNAKLREELRLSRGREVAAETRATALKARVEQLESSVARANHQVEGLDRAQRSNKMVFFNHRTAATDDLVEATRTLLRGVGCAAETRITAAVRLGPARAPTAGDARGRLSPVKVTFQSPEDVYEVFKACKTLREQHKVYVDRDLTAQQRDIRAALAQEYKGLRENGFRPFWRGEKLFYSPARGSRPVEVTADSDLPTAPSQPEAQA